MHAQSAQQIITSTGSYLYAAFPVTRLMHAHLRIERMLQRILMIGFCLCCPTKFIGSFLTAVFDILDGQEISHLLWKRTSVHGLAATGKNMTCCAHALCCWAMLDCHVRVITETGASSLCSKHAACRVANSIWQQLCCIACKAQTLELSRHKPGRLDCAPTFAHMSGCSSAS